MSAVFLQLVILGVKFDQKKSAPKVFFLQQKVGSLVLKYPPGNQHIPPWEKEHHLQKYHLQGIC